MATMNTKRMLMGSVGGRWALLLGDTAILCTDQLPWLQTWQRSPTVALAWTLLYSINVWANVWGFSIEYIVEIWAQNIPNFFLKFCDLSILKKKSSKNPAWSLRIILTNDLRFTYMINDTGMRYFRPLFQQKKFPRWSNIVHLWRLKTWTRLIIPKETP